ncbi:MAG: hypothetical protein P1P90_00380 [Patescibacteria group bacterium]|nr:hypothetical protein [Patescibacteria group bacterium]
MNYVQVISDFFVKRSQGGEFEPALLKKLEKDRQSLDEDGLILYIEAKGDVEEEIKEIKNGVMAIKYEGSFIHAFKKDGLLQPTPTGKPFENQDDAIEKGKMVFLVSPEGKVISWFNSLTGNMIGNPTKVDAEWNKRLWIIGILVALFVIWMFFGGGLF